MSSAPRGRVAARVGFVAATCTALFAAALFFAGSGTADAQEADGQPAVDVVPDPEVRAPALNGGGLVPVRDVVATAAVRAGAVTTALAESATPPPPPPVYCPAPGSQFVDSWGFARSGGRRHKGVDMMAPYGTPVIAPVDGVVRASSSSLGGIGFYLDEAEGNEFFGSHLASLDVVGPVAAGTQIGTVGSTGNAGTPHLHFEVKPAGSSSVNPFPFAANWCWTDFEQPDAEPLLP